MAETSQGLECQAQELGHSLRAIGSHSRVGSSPVSGKMHVSRRPVTAVQKMDRRAGVEAGDQ